MENSFSKWKNYVRRRDPSSEEELIEYINCGWMEITESDCLGFWRNMLAYLRRCLDVKEIRD